LELSMRPLTNIYLEGGKDSGKKHTNRRLSTARVTS
jgi:hypothetical protein